MLHKCAVAVSDQSQRHARSLSAGRRAESDENRAGLDFVSLMDPGSASSPKKPPDRVSRLSAVEFVESFDLQGRGVSSGRGQSSARGTVFIPAHGVEENKQRAATARRRAIAKGKTALLLEKRTARHAARAQAAAVTSEDAVLRAVASITHHPAPVEAGVYLGDANAASSAATLNACGITHLVELQSCRRRTTAAAAYAAEEAAEEDGYPKDASCRSEVFELTVTQHEGNRSDALLTVASKLIVRVDDADDGKALANHFDAINAFVRKATAPGAASGVLVYGETKGATEEAAACAVVQYLMQGDGSHTRSSLEALGLAKAAQPQLLLSAGGKRALMALERRLRPGKPPSVNLSTKLRKLSSAPAAALGVSSLNEQPEFRASLAYSSDLSMPSGLNAREFSGDLCSSRSNAAVTTALLEWQLDDENAEVGSGELWGANRLTTRERAVGPRAGRDRALAGAVVRSGAPSLSAAAAAAAAAPLVRELPRHGSSYALPEHTPLRRRELSAHWPKEPRAMARIDATSLDVLKEMGGGGGYRDFVSPASEAAAWVSVQRAAALAARLAGAGTAEAPGALLQAAKPASRGCLSAEGSAAKSAWRERELKRAQKFRVVKAKAPLLTNRSTQAAAAWAFAARDGSYSSGKSGNGSGSRSSHQISNRRGGKGSGDEDEGSRANEAADDLRIGDLVLDAAGGAEEPPGAEEPMLSVFSASSSLPLASPPPQRASISFAGSIKGRIPPAMMKSAFVSPIKAARSQRCFSGRTTGVLRIAKPSPRLSPSPAMFPGSPCLLLTEAEAEKAQGFEAVPCKPAEYSTTRAANSAAISVALQRGLPPPTPLQSQDTMSSARDGGAGVYAPSSQGTTVKPSLGGDQAQDKERLQAAGRRAGLKARTVLLLYRKQARSAPRSAPQSRPSSAPPPSLILVDAGGAANDAAFAAPRAAPASKKPGVALYGNAEAEHRASLKVRAALLARARQDAAKQPSWVSAHAGLGLALWR